MEITALWNKSIMTYGHLFYTDVYCQWTCKMILQTMDSTIMILSFELMMLFIHSSPIQGWWTLLGSQDESKRVWDAYWKKKHILPPSLCWCFSYSSIFSAFSLTLLCSPADKSKTYSLWQVFMSRYWFIRVYTDKPGSIPYFFFFPFSSNPMSRPNQQCTNPSLNTLWFRYPHRGSQLRACWF